MFRAEKLAVSSSSDFINDGGFEIHKYCSWHVFSCSGFREKGVERVISTSNCFVRGHLTIGLNTMFEAVKFPTGITDLAASLADMNGDTFTLK